MSNNINFHWLVRHVLETGGTIYTFGKEPGMSVEYRKDGDSYVAITTWPGVEDTSVLDIPEIADKLDDEIIVRVSKVTP